MVGKKCFFLENIFSGANILVVPTTLQCITMTEYFSCIYWGHRIILQQDPLNCGIGRRLLDSSYDLK